ncbi:MAG: SURF1 family protein [Pseudomonas sp.]
MKTFRPGVLPSVLVALLLPLLISLGVWQLARAEEKRALLASDEIRRAATPIGLNELEQRADIALIRVRLHGQFDERHSLLLDNRTRAGQAGVELLQPFYDQASGLWLLVNRGWMPWPDRRIPVSFTTPAEPLQLVAQVYVPPGATFQLQPDAASGDWPRLINRVDAPALWQQLGRGGMAQEVRLEPGPASLRIDWPVVSMAPEQHTGYAVQWFALAAALLCLYIYLGLHTAREKNHESSHESSHPQL